MSFAGLELRSVHSETNRSGAAEKIVTRYSYLLILAILLIVYRDAFLHNYFFADDSHIYPAYLLDWPHLDYAFFGRPVADLLLYASVLTYKIGHTTQIAHLINIVFLSTLSFLIYRAVQPRFSPVLAFCFAVTFACLPSLQIHVAYARIFSYLIAYILSYVAVRIVLTNWRSPLAWLGFVVLVGVAYHIFQAAAFVGLVFVLAALINLPEDDLRANLKKAAVVTFGLAGVVLASAATYRIVLYLLGEHSSRRTKISLGVIDGQLSVLGHLHPLQALNVFEIWSYIYPLPALSSWTHKLIYILAAVLIAVAICARYFLAGRKKSDLLVIAVGLVLFLGSLLPIVMDSFSRRQHLYVAPQAILLLLLFWSLSAFRKGTLVLVAATALAVVSTAIAFPRKLVFPELAARQYVEKAILEGSTPHDSIRIIVVGKGAPPSCRIEPCTGFFGREQASLRHKGSDLLANVAAALDRKLEKRVFVSTSKAKVAIKRAERKPEKVIVIRVKEADAWYRETYE